MGSVAMVIMGMLVMACLSPTGATPMVRQPLAEDPGAVCSDGTPAAYYHSDDVTRRQSDTFVIFLEGGGYCHDVKLCAWRCSVAPHLCTAPMATTLAERDGILSDDPEENPHFWQSYKVDLPYCTGDMYIGQRSADPDTLGYNFVGRRVFTTMIESLRLHTGIARARDVILTGSSAGGAGVAFNCDYLKELLPDANIWCVVDAAFFYPASGPLQNVTSCQSIDRVLAAAAQLWKVPYLNQFKLKGWWEDVRQPVFIGMAKFDMFGLESFCVNETLATDLVKWARGITLMARDFIHKYPDIGIYMPGCLRHMMVTDKKAFAHLPVGPMGLTYDQALHNWMKGQKPIHAADYCPEQLLCNDNC